MTDFRMKTPAATWLKDWRKWDVKWRDSWEGLQIPRQRGGTKPRSWHDIELYPFSPHSPSPTLISLPLFFLFLFFCLFLVALGLHSCTQPFSSCNAQASHGGGFSYCEAQALATWFNNCLWLAGLVLHGTWNLPRPGIELVSPALAGGFLSTAPPRKSLPFLSFGPSRVSECWPRRWREGYCLGELHSLHSKHEVPPGIPADHQRRSLMTLYSWALMDCV